MWYMFWLQEERQAPTTVLSTMLLSPELWPLNQSKGINRFSSYFHSYNLRFKLFGTDFDKYDYYGHFFWQISSQKSSWFTEKPITEEYAQCPLGEGCWYVSHKPVIRNSDRGLIVCLNVQRFNSSSFPALL